MTHSFCLAALCCCLLVAVDGAAAAASANVDSGTGTGTDPSLVIEQHRQHVMVNPDGSFLLTVDSVKRIAGQNALQEHSRYHVRYNHTLDEVVSVEAYTEKPDGRRIKVLPENIKEQQEAVAGEAPVLLDTRLKIVAFLDVALGDRLALHYVVKRHTALFPGHFEDLSSSPLYQNRAFELIYDMPASMPLYSDARGFAPFALASAAGRKVYAWHYVSGANARIEADSVSYLDYGKRLAVSTFANYQALARAFAARAQDTRGITPAIAALAPELTRTLPTPRAKALALADWVRRNIRYVEVGVGGVVPHPAATVLTRRHGGSLDHANLLGALLAALGIDSSSALINNANAYRLPRVPTLGVFNHVITFVPSLELYLDSTAATIAAGYLPTADLGKPVLLTGSGKLAATPASQKDQSSSVSWFRVRQNGDSSFKVSRLSAGALAEPLRQTVRDTAPAARDRFVQRLLQGLGQQGTGEFDAGRLDDSGDTYAMGLSGTSWHFADLAGPARVATDFSAWGGLKASVARFTRERTRSHDFICPAIDVQDVTSLAFAPNVRISALPKALTLNEANVAYAASYARKGNTVLIERRLRFYHDAMVCTPAEFRRMQPLFERMQRDLDSVLIVQGR
ncbi:MAG: DUF3857 and transglutaminase domain-containing protein [Massilia sp.]|nr:DUF3857 and transglutaminase domain-containing protein [Massilia sp.]